MQTLSRLEDFRASRPIVLTIGNFDGVHLGHQAVLNRMKDYEGTERVVLTYSNHPSTILSPTPTPLLTTPLHKLHLLEIYEVDTTLLLPFTMEFSLQTAESFLTRLRDHLPFSHLALGHDATLGHQKRGTREAIDTLASKMDFSVEYLDPFCVKGKIVSSSTIRRLIRERDFDSIPPYLGRRYSIYGEIEQGLGHGERIGYPTANLSVEGLCLPPFGVYGVLGRFDGREALGVANLGFAPTIRESTSPLLETHFFDLASPLKTKTLEIIPLFFIRPEEKFPSLEALKEQISLDIQHTKERIKTSSLETT